MAALGVSIGQDAFTDIRSLFQTSLNGMQKEDATTVVNGLEPLFNENLQNFLKNPTPATQQEAISNFNYMWLTMVQNLENYAKGGTAGVNDRAPGGKFDWWKLFYNPIYNYTFPPQMTQSAIQPQDNGAGGSPVSGAASASIPTTASSTTATPAATQQAIAPVATSAVVPYNGGAIVILILLLGLVGVLIYRREVA